VAININSNQHIAVLFKVKYEDNNIISIGSLQKLNKEDKDYYIGFIKDLLSLKMEGYINTPIIEIKFYLCNKKWLSSK